MNIDPQATLRQIHALLTTSQEEDFFQNKKNYTDLIDYIIDNNHLYYRDNNPIISDYEYDKLFDLLKQFESLHPEYIRDDSPTQKLIGQDEIQTEFKKSNHQTPILSLQNTYNSEDIIERYESITHMLYKKIETIQDEEKKKNLTFKISNLKFLIEPKYDGLAIVLTYLDGKIYKAVTRGDGYTGDDVTENIKTIKNLPLILPSGKRGAGGDLINNTIIVRGEVLMSKSVRKKINKQREENNEEPFANTRNAAAGSLKLLDPNEVKKRGLECYIYDVLQGEPSDLNFFTQHHAQGLEQEQTISDITNIITNESTQSKLLQADIDFDGLVIKVVDLEIRELLGSTNHHPRRAIAYKFPAQQIATKIKSIERQIGRTGILTPVANLTPTELSGVTISRVSLHNRDFITTKNIHCDDWVWLQRSGEVIPYIVAVITNRRDGTQKEISADSIYCPACKTKAQRVENQVGTKTKPIITTQFFCTNTDCPGILKEQLKHFVSKNCMNIASIGDSIVEMLVDQQLLSTISDIYTLTHPEKIFLLKRLPGIGDKKIETFIDEIEKSKTNLLRRLLNGLGISGIGIKLAKEISAQLEKCGRGDLKDLNEIFEVINNPEFISSIFGIGDKLIEELSARYTDPDNKKLLKEFQKHGIKFQTFNSTLSTLNSKVICITGTFPLSRSELEFYIGQAGYTFSPTLTKSVDYLLVGEHAGSKKDKIGPKTKSIDNIQEIYTILGISTPLFAEGESHPLDKGGLGGFAQGGQTEMQSLFG